MIIFGGLLFTLIALAILCVFANEWNKESAKKKKAQDELRRQVEDALSRKDLNGLRRIRVINANGLESLDPGLGGRLDEVIDQISIEEDDERKYRSIA